MGKLQPLYIASAMRAAFLPLQTALIWQETYWRTWENVFRVVPR